MNYEEAYEYEPSRKEVDVFIREHGLDPKDFWDEVESGYLEYVHRPIIGKDVLDWLGY